MGNSTIRQGKAEIEKVAHMSLHWNFGELYKAFNTSRLRRKNIVQKIIAPFRYSLVAFYRGILSCKVGAFDPAHTIYITGSSRSGTTWLAELLWSHRDYCLVFEPTTTPLWNRYLDALGPFWRERIAPGTSWPEGKELFAQLFQGRFVAPHAFLHNSPVDLLRCRSLVIKDVGTSMLLPWLAANFQIRGMILIIRHPCAVVASLKRHLPEAPQRLAARRLWYVKENLPHLASYIQSLRTEEELLAVGWCCDQHAPLKFHQNGSWIQTSYEKLVLDGPSELKRIYRALGLSETAEAYDNLRSSSLTTRNWSVDHSSASVEQRLSNWRHMLDDDAVKRILYVVKAFGIQGYKEDIIPDFDAIGLTV